MVYLTGEGKGMGLAGCWKRLSHLSSSLADPNIARTDAKFC
jgi:hypothetical protein